MRRIFKAPSDCSKEELDTFERLVVAGGEVSQEGLRPLIERAEKLIFIYDGDCVAVGAIKNPNARYKSRVFEKAKVAAQSEYKHEIGWLYVSNEARGKGCGRALMEEIKQLLVGIPCYATTREDNGAMHYLFSQFGFSRVGQPYKSQERDHLLTLYVTA